ncbi:MAG: segregation/condensation protein A [Clostridiales bacterium]|nr:segregation/condensation protein A [Clostridiales bacterium]
MENKISYKIDVFEGPMDLLLHLISKHKLNIYDIPIIELVEQYVSYVRQMQDADMDVASEFLEMAARLVYIKTVSLLPVHEEADELKRELTGELLEYRDCQIMAGKLADAATGFDRFVREPEELPVDMTYKRLHEPEELLQAFINTVGKKQRKLPPPVSAFSGIISHKIVSVSSRIIFVLRRLIKGKKQKFASLFEHSQTKSEMIATFLAVLELVKAKRVKVNSDNCDEEYIELSKDKKVKGVERV